MAVFNTIPSHLAAFPKPKRDIGVRGTRYWNKLPGSQCNCTLAPWALGTRTLFPQPRSLFPDHKSTLQA